MRPLRTVLPTLLLALAVPWAGPAAAAGVGPKLAAARKAVLPPELPWDGASRSLVAAPDDPWITPAEASGLTRTPSYQETVDWLSRLAAAAPEVEMVSLGKSPEGRDVWMVVASAEGFITPEALAASGKPVLLAQAGIHAGEIDGKDAGLMLLRDLTVGGRLRGLLDRVHFLFVPILSVDAHERSGPYGRINQRGPEEMGWRTNSKNLNLNRDYTKLDTPELRAVITGALERYSPDLYLDLHVTDGADYQYDVTYGANGTHAYSPAIGTWIAERLVPALDRDLKAQGHVPGPLIFLVDPTDPSQGMVGWTAGPRFSNGYGDLRHLPTLLVENHSLKPYDQRVLGTYVLLESALSTLASDGTELRRAVALDRARRPDPVPLAWGVGGGPHATTELLGVASRLEPSTVSGGEALAWTGEPVTLEIPLLAADVATVTASRPRAYWIPPAWREVIGRLALHGIEMERIHEAREVEVEMYRFDEAILAPEPFEGHARVTASAVLERRRELFPPGSVRVSTDQPLGDLAVLLLEPASPDSFFQWGFFLEVLQRTEYAEGYVMEPMARAMLEESPELAREFEEALAADPELAADPRARLQWFYRRTPFWDDRHLLYPVAREPAPEAAP